MGISLINRLGGLLNSKVTVPILIDFKTNSNMQKIINLIVLVSLPLILSLLTLAAWFLGFAAFREYFYFPWGDDRSTYPLSTTDLLIYNGVQLFFICLLFLATISIYCWTLKKFSKFKTAKRSSFIAISFSWILFVFLAFSLAEFICCPGFLPKVFNSLWWLTKADFAVFAIVGEIYLIRKIRSCTSGP
jgi:hypothetical protein